MRHDVGYTELTGKLKKETQKAYLIHITRVDDCDLEIPISKWVPISQINSALFDPDGDDKFMVATWIVDKMELV